MLRTSRASVVQWSVDYFSQVPSWCSVRCAVEDRAVVAGVVHVAWRFQTGVILEFLRGFRPLRNEAVWQQADKELAFGTERWGFRYFDSDLLPADLDTASAVVRGLGGRHNGVIRTYNQILNSHRSVWPVLPTWLGDSPLATRSLLGLGACHSDVLLGLLLAEASLGRRVSGDDIARVIAACGLSPFWYLQEGQPLFLLSRLVPDVSVLDSSTAATVASAVGATLGGNAVFHRATNRNPNLSALLLSQRSSALATAYRAAVADWAGLDGSAAWASVLEAVSTREDPAAPFWTVGFRPFWCRALAIALIGSVAIEADGLKLGLQERAS